MSLQPGSLFRFVPMIFIMGTIFFLSHQPGDSLQLSPFPGWDKVAHMTVYGLLAGSIIYGFSPSFRQSNPHTVMLLTVSICFFYGISDEWHQSYIPNREQSLADIVADLCGGVSVCVIWFLGRKWRVTSS